MKLVKIRDLEIGEGKPKICVPIVGRAKDEILEEAKKVSISGADLAELRIDYYEDVADLKKTEEVLNAVRDNLKEMPLLFTFRTKQEGGEQAIENAQYRELLLMAAKTGCIDMADVELFLGDEFVQSLTNELKESHVAVVMSNHNFDKTNTKEELLHRMRKMQDLGADIAKVAMMPTCPEDVLVLLQVTTEMKEQFAKIPLITMSMGKMGAVSRIAGETFGSSVTFACAGKASAPGQMEVDHVRQMLEIL